MKELNNEKMGINAMLAVWKYQGSVYSISEYCQGGELIDVVNGVLPKLDRNKRKTRLLLFI